MKIQYSSAILCAGLMIVSGCATSSQVQEMIDASHRDYLTMAESHEASIDVLKKSAMTGLEKSKENSELLAAIRVELDDVKAQMKVVQGYADASKVMSAANTVKVANLEESVQANKEAVDAAIRQLEDIDKLYEEVMIRHYQLIVDSASAAVEALMEDGATASTNAPVKLDKPIEIVAPDTSAAATNGTPE